jgi:4-hydroxybutyrate CoA-transferase
MTEPSPVAKKAVALSAAEAVSLVQSGHRVFVHGGAATPGVLLDALVADAARLTNVELVHLHTAGNARYADAAFAGNFRVVNLFVGENMRKRLDRERVDYLPCFLSEIPMLFRNRRRPLDVALVSLSPPDKHGYCTLGTSVDVARAAVDSADIVIAQVNRAMPRVLGDGVVRLDEVDAFVDVDVKLPESPAPVPTPAEEAVGRNVAGLVDNGATLQMGIGTIPDAVCRALHSHRQLGIHTEMWSDGALDLILSGAVDNSRKKIHAGRTVSGFVTGSRRLYDFIDDNPEVLQLDIAYVNNPAVIARNPRVCAINSAVEIDLTGQVCADSVGPRVISGVGGQMDFLRGAALSEGGKPILALTSRTKHGKSRLVPQLTPGAGVVTTRAHVHYVVTEHGVADLFGRTLGERAAALIGVAHPDDREALAKAWHEGAAQL